MPEFCSMAITSGDNDAMAASTNDLFQVTSKQPLRKDSNP